MKTLKLFDQFNQFFLTGGAIKNRYYLNFIYYEKGIFFNCSIRS
jgi:hypothetical protein